MVVITACAIVTHHIYWFNISWQALDNLASACLSGNVLGTWLRRKNKKYKKKREEKNWLHLKFEFHCMHFMVGLGWQLPVKSVLLNSIIYQNDWCQCKLWVVRHHVLERGPNGTMWSMVCNLDRTAIPPVETLLSCTFLNDTFQNRIIFIQKGSYILSLCVWTFSWST